MPPRSAASTIGCLFIPNFRLRVALLGQSQLDGQPLLLGAPPGERPRIIDMTPEAAASGVRPGMSLREGLALCPEAITLVPDPIHETRVWGRVLSCLEGLSPGVEAAAPGIAYLDLGGSVRSLGPSAVAAERMLAAVTPALRPRVGIAPGKFAALAAARVARAGGSRIIAPTELATFLAELPSDWLPLPPDQLTLLDRLGLTTMGALTALPPAAVGARLGPAGRRAWTLAAGHGDHDDTVVRTQPPAPITTAALELPHSTADRDTLLHALDLLVERVFRDDTLRGRAARRATLRVKLDHGGSWERSFALKEAVGKDRLRAKLRLRLGQIELPGVITALELEVVGVARETARQGLLPSLHPQQPIQLAEAIQALSARYGGSPIYRVVGVEPWSRIPERRYALTPYAP